MTDLDLDAIEARADAATDGPWVVKLLDAEFIAHARTDVPALVAALREARAKVEAMRSWIDGAKVDLDGYDDARAAIDRVRALHVRMFDTDRLCSECSDVYPCATIRALGGGATDPQEARCSTPDCPGDWRYAAPGRGHTAECKHPADFREWVGQAFPPTTDPQTQEGS